jgi:hypothetical protein
LPFLQEFPSLQILSNHSSARFNVDTIEKQNKFLGTNEQNNQPWRKNINQIHWDREHLLRRERFSSDSEQTKTAVSFCPFTTPGQ